MKKILILMLCLAITQTSFGWGQKGHDIVAYIAECNLSSKAAKKIDKILCGHSMVYYADWMDGIRGMDEFRHTAPWHYLNVDKDETFETRYVDPKGDVLSAVEAITIELKSGTLTAEEEFIKLKMLIHLVGDMHCPAHTNRRSDKGGNNYDVKFFYRNTRLHSIWDTTLIDYAHKWSYTEWRNQIDIYSKKETKELQSGTPTDWVRDSWKYSVYIYTNTPQDENLSYAYLDMASPILEDQLLKGGLRLAKLLNEIYN